LRGERAALFGGTFYVIAVGFSRQYLGVHYPSDVLGGWLLALAWAGGISGLRLRVRATGQPDWIKLAIRFGVGLAAGLMLVLAGYVSSDLAHNNLRVVAPGRVYRSGQMSAAGFARTIMALKGILNLRGENPGTAWNQAETATAATLNVVHYDRSLGSGTPLKLAQMNDLVILLRQSPKPILIHCNGGADRSALVAALYDFAILGQKPARRTRNFPSGTVMCRSSGPR